MKKLDNILQTIKKYNIFMIVMFVAIWMGVLVSNNYSNHQNLSRNQLNKDIRVFEDDLRLLNATVSELQTTERVEKESQRLDLVKIPTDDIIYLHVGNDKVALR
jgi:hypothetical protein